MGFLVECNYWRVCEICFLAFFRETYRPRISQAKARGRPGIVNSTSSMTVAHQLQGRTSCGGHLYALRNAYPVIHCAVPRSMCQSCMDSSLFSLPPPLRFLRQRMVSLKEKQGWRILALFCPRCLDPCYYQHFELRSHC